MNSEKNLSASLDEQEAQSEKTVDYQGDAPATRRLPFAKKERGVGIIAMNARD